MLHNNDRQNNLFIIDWKSKATASFKILKFISGTILKGLCYDTQIERPVQHIYQKCYSGKWTISS